MNGPVNCCEQPAAVYGLRSSWRGYRSIAHPPRLGSTRQVAVSRKRWVTSMDKFLIQGGRPLEGEIAISGAKNSALPALAACLLTEDPVKLNRIPPVRDIRTMQKLLEHTGARVTVEG